MNKIITLDIETTLKSKKSFAASQHEPDNSIVYLGYKQPGEPEVTVLRKPDALALIDLLGKADLIVGQNIKFDLTYIKQVLSHSYWNSLVSKGLKIWDTQLAEYLITGQETKLASLDELATKYEGVLKNSEVKDYWDKGISTENIPENKILPYLKNDVLNTELVAIQQMKTAQKLNMLPLILSQMDALLAVTECEYNGMYIDVLKAEKHINILTKNTELLTEELNKILSNRGLSTEFIKSDSCKLASTKQVAYLIYGGAVKWTVKKQLNNAVYKTGKRKGEPKLSNVVETFMLLPMTNSIPNKSSKGNIKVDDKELQALLEDPRNKTNLVLDDYISKLSELKLNNKSLNTYYKPLADTNKLLWEHDSRVHHTLNQCTTVTGRLSSSSPNLQNVPRGSTSGVKEIFTSRFSDGYIVEADYSQLEVVVLAWLTQDTQLMFDVSNGVDMHTENAATLFNVATKDVTKEQRTKAKIGTFQLQYGAGAATIAGVFNGDTKLAEGLINAYYTRYPGVKKYFKTNLDNLNSSKAKRIDHVKSLAAGTKIYRMTPLNKVQQTAQLHSVTGRRYTFNTYDSPIWSKELTGFSPTEIKNYPVQGLATADVVPLMLGKIYRNVMAVSRVPDQCKLINTVHDSFIFDVAGPCVKYFVEDLKVEMVKVHYYLREYFGIDFNLPLKAEIEVGKTWASVEVYDKNKEYK